MKDHEIAIIVNNLKLCAQVYHDSDQLRERIAHIVVDSLKDAPVQPVAVPDGWIATMANGPGKSVFTRSRFMPVKRDAEVCSEQWRKETPFYHVEVVGVFFAAPAAQGNDKDAARWRFSQDYQNNPDQPQPKQILDLWRKVTSEGRRCPTAAEYEEAIDAAIADKEAQNELHI